MRLMERIQSLTRRLLTEKESATYKFGCVMLSTTIDSKIWDDIQRLINDEDVFEGEQFGREDQPHITLLYGIHENVPDEVVKGVVDEFIKPIKLTLDKVGIFEQDDYDVVKFEIKDKNLDRFNKTLKDSLEYTSDYPDYKAHLTIAYVKPGLGADIAKSIEKHLSDQEITIDCDEVSYSTPKNGKKKYKLNEK